MIALEVGMILQPENTISPKRFAEIKYIEDEHVIIQWHVINEEPLLRWYWPLAGGKVNKTLVSEISILMGYRIDEHILKINGFYFSKEIRATEENETPMPSKPKKAIKYEDDHVI